ncbi:LysR substrate-binding domain-containing protein [Nocardia sp. NPDC004123]
MSSTGPRSGLRRQLDRAAAQAGTRLRIPFEAGYPGLLVTMAAHGLGIALVPESALAHGDRVVGVPVPELSPGRISIAWRDADAADPATDATRPASPSRPPPPAARNFSAPPAPATRSDTPAPTTAAPRDRTRPSRPSERPIETQSPGRNIIAPNIIQH